MFIGRKYELKQLGSFHSRKIAGLAVVRGRRRIGKSTLVEHFAAINKEAAFLEFFGLSPREGGTSTKAQLKHFGELMGIAFQTPPMHFDNWNYALSTLASLTKTGSYIILLDEISWMARNNKDFPGKLKGIWDTQFKKNDQLRLFLCGSITSWINDNILNDKGFMGRISLTLTLEDMPLSDANQFWKENHLTQDFTSAREKFTMLNVTGGIPRYLEEIQPKQTAEQNLQRLCFTKEGLLFNEYEQIFTDIFEKKSEEYTKIVECLTNGSLGSKEICSKLSVQPSGGFSKKLQDLVSAGFIGKDLVWDMSGQKTTLSKYRLKDNYLRFYLKYIRPKAEKIEQGIYDENHLESFPDWCAFLDLQFENLVLNNLRATIQKLNIPFECILNASPYFQRKTQKQDACQIDLLIHTKHSLYVCEIKFRNKIETDVIETVQQKIMKLNYPRQLSVRPVLIYHGTLSTKIITEDYFTRLIPFEDFFKSD